MTAPSIALANLTFDYPPGRGRDLQPKRVEQVQFGITWHMTEILDHWAHPGRAEDTLGKPVLIKWWHLKICGRLVDYRGSGYPVDPP